MPWSLPQKVHLTQRIKMRNYQPHLHFFESSSPQAIFSFHTPSPQAPAPNSDTLWLRASSSEPVNPGMQLFSEVPSTLSFIAPYISLLLILMTFPHAAFSKIFWGKISFPASSGAPYYGKHSLQAIERGQREVPRC